MKLLERTEPALTDGKLLRLNPYSPSMHDQDDADVLRDAVVDLELAREDAPNAETAQAASDVIAILMDAIPVPDNVIPLQRGRGKS